MQGIRRFFKSLKLRDTWDVYVNILLAIGVGAYRALGGADDRVVVSFTLAILGLLAINILRNRWTNERLQTTLSEFEGKLPAGDQVFATQNAAEDFLESYVKSHRVLEAVLVQYGVTPNSFLVGELLEAGAKVTLFLQHESVAEKLGSKLQVNRITDYKSNLANTLSRAVDQYPLEVYAYCTPASVYGVRIDGEVLCMSWYTYEQVDESNMHWLGEQYREDNLLVFGHNRAAILVDKGDRSFEFLNQIFNVLVENYRKNALRVFPAVQQDSRQAIASP